MASSKDGAWTPDLQDSRGAASRSVRAARRSADSNVQERKAWHTEGWVKSGEWQNGWWEQDKDSGEWHWKTMPIEKAVHVGSQRWRQMKEMEQRLGEQEARVGHGLQYWSACAAQVDAKLQSAERWHGDTFSYMTSAMQGCNVALAASKRAEEAAQQSHRVAQRVVTEMHRPMSVSRSSPSSTSSSSNSSSSTSQPSTEEVAKVKEAALFKSAADSFEKEAADAVKAAEAKKDEAAKATEKKKRKEEATKAKEKEDAVKAKENKRDAAAQAEAFAVSERVLDALQANRPTKEHQRKISQMKQAIQIAADKRELREAHPDVFLPAARSQRKATPIQSKCGTPNKRHQHEADVQTSNTDAEREDMQERTEIRIKNKEDADRSRSSRKTGKGDLGCMTDTEDKADARRDKGEPKKKERDDKSWVEKDKKDKTEKKPDKDNGGKKIVQTTPTHWKVVDEVQAFKKIK